MKKIIIALLCVVCLSTAMASQERPKRPIPGQEYSLTTLIVSYDGASGKASLLKAIEEYGAEVKYDYKLIDAIALKLPDGADLEKAIKYFKGVDGVLSVEKDRIIRLDDPVKPRLETF